MTSISISILNFGLNLPSSHCSNSTIPYLNRRVLHLNPLKVWTNTKKVRARNSDGTLKADDPSTPDVNEAWEEAPATKRGRPKKKG